MKPYRKPIMAVDSDRLIVIDENMKRMSFFTFMMKGLSFLALLFLTAIGFCWGVSLDAVQEKLIDIDQWAAHPESQKLMFFAGIGFFVIAGMWFVLYVFFFRRK